jgi:lysozyme family protein
MAGLIDNKKSYNYNKEFYGNTETQEKLNDPEFDSILGNTLQHEGGFTVDVGGPTNQGITQKSYDSYITKMGSTPKSVKELKPEEVGRFYHDEFYTAPKLNTIPYQSVKGILFDYAVNSGSQRAVKDLQKEVGVEVDGSLGPKTLSAVDKYVKQYGETFLAHQILNRRANYMITLSQKNPDKYSKYLQGWLNRISNLKEQYQLNQ